MYNNRDDFEFDFDKIKDGEEVVFNTQEIKKDDDFWKYELGSMDTFKETAKYVSSTFSIPNGKYWTNISKIFMKTNSKGKPMFGLEVVVTGELYKETAVEEGTNVEKHTYFDDIEKIQDSKYKGRKETQYFFPFPSTADTLEKRNASKTKALSSLADYLKNSLEVIRLTTEYNEQFSNEIDHKKPEQVAFEIVFANYEAFIKGRGEEITFDLDALRLRPLNFILSKWEYEDKTTKEIKEGKKIYFPSTK